MTDAAEVTHEHVLRAAAEGARLWVPAKGNSLWPLLRDGDVLQVERTAAVRLGEVALVKRPDGIVTAHVVTGLAPLRTASLVGVDDPQPLELLAKVVAFRRGGLERTLDVKGLQWVPRLSRRLKTLPLARRLVRRLRD